MQAIKFTISGDYAHFKRLEGTTVQQTYYAPPKTTLVGMVAGILGYDRDTYYDDFGAVELSIVPDSNIDTFVIATLQLSLEDNASRVKNDEGTVKAPIKTTTPEKTRENRQRQPIQYLVDPEYTIYMQVPDETLQEEIVEALSNKQYEYTPYLGISECLCNIEYHGLVELEQTEVESENINSIIPESEMSDFYVTENNSIATERVASSMEQYQGGRRTTEFTDLVIDRNAEPISVDSDSVFVDPDNKKLLFY